MILHNTTHSDKKACFNRTALYNNLSLYNNDNNNNRQIIAQIAEASKGR